MISNEKIAYYRFRCTCDRLDIGYDKKDHVYKCRHCYARLEPIIGDENQTTDWNQVADERLRQITIIRSRMTAFITKLAREGRYTTGLPEPRDRPADNSAYLDTICKLERANDSIQDRLRQAEVEIADLNSTIDHLKAEDRRRSSVDVHGAMEAVLEYMCDAEAAPERKDTPEKLRRYIRNLTENTIMKLEGRGIIITSERPGHPVSGPVDVTDRIVTDDRTLDGKVESNERFGCGFKENAYPRISNRVRIYQYREDSSKD